MPIENEDLGQVSTVVAAVRHHIVAGDWLPGEQIKVNIVASEMRVSATPVREALSRLVGMRLVEERRRHGYFVPILTAYDLVDLYSLAELLVEAALAVPPPGSRPFRPSRAASRLSDAADDDASPMRCILGRSDNLPLAEAGGILLDRLEAVRRVEDLVLGTRESEAAEIRRQLLRGERLRVAELVRRYHALRRSRAEALAYAAASGPGAFQI